MGEIPYSWQITGIGLAGWYLLVCGVLIGWMLRRKVAPINFRRNWIPFLLTGPMSIPMMVIWLLWEGVMLWAMAVTGYARRCAYARACARNSRPQPKPQLPTARVTSLCYCGRKLNHRGVHRLPVEWMG